MATISHLDAIRVYTYTFFLLHLVLLTRIKAAVNMDPGRGVLREVSATGFSGTKTTVYAYTGIGLYAYKQRKLHKLATCISLKKDIAEKPSESREAAICKKHGLIQIKFFMGVTGLYGAWKWKLSSVFRNTSGFGAAPH